MTAVIASACCTTGVSAGASCTFAVPFAEPEVGMTRSRLVFGVVVFLGSFLLFLVEPIAAKQLLPVLGGSAAVWITCLVFFQTALLCAYLYAHWLSRSSQWSLHSSLLLLAAAAAII